MECYGEGKELISMVSGISAILSIQFSGEWKGQFQIVLKMNCTYYHHFQIDNDNFFYFLWEVELP
jgi:hypothetical protein